jgi:actin-related protein 2
MVFLGGAVLANLVSFLRFGSLVPAANTLTPVQLADKENMWISKQEWQEQGARILSKLGPR